MKCKRCGEEIPENGKICEFCGASLTDDEFEYQVPEYPFPPQPDESPYVTSQPVELQFTPQKSSKIKWIIGGMILIILLMGGAIALNMLSHQQKAEEKEVKQEQRLHKLDSIYTKAMGKFEIHLKKIMLFLTWKPPE